MEEAASALPSTNTSAKGQLDGSLPIASESTRSPAKGIKFSANDEVALTAAVGSLGLEEEGEGEGGADEICPTVTVDQDSQHPHKAWVTRLKATVPELRPLKQKDLVRVSEDEKKAGSQHSKHFLRVVCLSDTHGRVERKSQFYDEFSRLSNNFVERVPDGDVLLHAGDFTMCGDRDEVVAFNTFLGQLPHKFKFVIPGNHETSFDPRYGQSSIRAHTTSQPSAGTDQSILGLVGELTNAIYLQDTLVEFCGLRLHGLPWMPEYGSWGFGMHRGHQLLRMYDLVPAGVDILLSHGPPVGIGDTTSHGKHAGCVELFHSIRQRIKPKFFVCGHIHEGQGTRTDGTSTYINAAVCNKIYRPVHDPVVFDLPLPPPYTSEDFHLLHHLDLKLTRFEPCTKKPS